METPTRKDLAEFYRLALACGLGAPADVVKWADGIVAADARPDVVFLDLACAAHQPAAAVQTLPHDVPGAADTAIVTACLLDLAVRRVREGGVSALDMTQRLYALARKDPLLDGVANTLGWLEDDYALARDGLFGTVAEVDARVVEFLGAGRGEEGRWGCRRALRWGWALRWGRRRRVARLARTALVGAAGGTAGAGGADVRKGRVSAYPRLADVPDVRKRRVSAPTGCGSAFLTSKAGLLQCQQYQQVRKDHPQGGGA